MRLQLLGESGEDIYSDNSQQLSQNWYPHTAKGGKSKLALYPTPGLTLFTDIGTGPIRGQINYNGTYFMVSGNQLYEVDAAGSGTLRGTLNTSIGRCSLDHNGANNGKQICIVDGTNGYIYNSNYQTFAQIKQFSTGNADTNTPNKLDLTAGGGDFINEGVKAGTVVYNTTDGTQGVVSAVDSKDILSIVNSAGVAYDLFPLGTEAYEVGTDAFPDGATHVEFFDSFFLWNDPLNSGRFFKSKGYDGTDIDALEFATAERSPDELEGLLKSLRVLWLVGKETAEAWFNSGAQDFPFEPIPAAFSEWGTVAKYSMISTAGLAFWISQNDKGNGMIIMARGLQISIISTPEIAAEIAAIDDISDCYSFAYQKYQHTFVAFTFPSGEKTIVYDTTEQKFHTWKSHNLGYHRSTGHTFVYDKHLVGDPVNGRVYCLDWDALTDNGDMIERIRRSPIFHAEDKGLDWEVLELDIKEGVGIPTVNEYITSEISGMAQIGSLLAITTTSAHGAQVGDTITITSSGTTPSIDGSHVVTSAPTPSLLAITATVTTISNKGSIVTYAGTIVNTPDPQIHLRWRDSNGKWSNYHSRSMGKQGEVKKKVRWRQLGYSEDSRVFEISVTDPVTAVLLDGYARVKADETEMR